MICIRFLREESFFTSFSLSNLTVQVKINVALTSITDGTSTVLDALLKVGVPLVIEINIHVGSKSLRSKPN